MCSLSQALTHACQIPGGHVHTCMSSTYRHMSKPVKHPFPRKYPYLSRTYIVHMFIPVTHLYSAHVHTCQALIAHMFIPVKHLYSVHMFIYLTSYCCLNYFLVRIGHQHLHSCHSAKKRLDCLAPQDPHIYSAPPAPPAPRVSHVSHVSHVSFALGTLLKQDLNNLNFSYIHYIHENRNIMVLKIYELSKVQVAKLVFTVSCFQKSIKKPP